MTVWVVVMDGARARVLISQQDGEELQESMSFVSEEALAHNRDLISDKPGRTHSSVGHNSAAMEPELDAQRHAKLAFAHKIARFLTNKQGMYDRLIFAAPPKTLGDVRAALGDALSDRIVAEMHKDLTHMNARDITQYFAELLRHRTRSIDPVKRKRHPEEA